MVEDAQLVLLDSSCPVADKAKALTAISALTGWDNGRLLLLLLQLADIQLEEALRCEEGPGLNTKHCILLFLLLFCAFW